MTITSVHRKKHVIKHDVASFKEICDFCQQNGFDIIKIISILLKNKNFIDGFKSGCYKYKKDRDILLKGTIMKKFPGISVPARIINGIFHHLYGKSLKRCHVCNYNLELIDEELGISQIGNKYFYDDSLDSFPVYNLISKKSVKTIEYKDYDIFLFPFNSFSRFTNQKKHSGGIYFLIGNHKKIALKNFYIGKTKNLNARLYTHPNSKKNGIPMNFTTAKVIWISHSEWNQKDIEFLEKYLIFNGNHFFPIRCLNRNIPQVYSKSENLIQEISKILRILNETFLIKHNLNFKIIE